MIYVNIPTTYEKELSFYLAAEEYIARNLRGDEYFFMWQVQPTVIFGRNQLIENEVNMKFCHQHGIRTFRRKSGGGCVYADMSNIMFSYITKDEDVRTTFGRYVNRIAQTLGKLGVDAKATGRNDIMVDNRKVSGNAFYHIPGHSIVHGTMLYDTDMRNMVGAITPSSEKLVSKGIKSVRQHITLLKKHIDLTIEEFKHFVKDDLCGSEISLSENAIMQIENIEKEYLSPQFIYGNNPKYNITRHSRIDNVGEITVKMEMKNNVINDANIMGDYFLVGDIDNGIANRLRGVELTKHALAQALPERIDDIIMGLGKEQLISLLLKE